MTEVAHRIAIVIPTIGRDTELRRRQASLVVQTRMRPTLG